MPVGIDHIWNSKPFFVNEIGTKWWKDLDTTEWAHKPDQFGTTLPDIYCFLIEDADGRRSRALINNATGSLLYESQQLEAIVVHIDMLKLVKRDEEHKN